MAAVTQKPPGDHPEYLHFLRGSAKKQTPTRMSELLHDTLQRIAVSTVILTPIVSGTTMTRAPASASRDPSQTGVGNPYPYPAAHVPWCNDRFCAITSTREDPSQTHLEENLSAAPRCRDAQDRRIRRQSDHDERAAHSTPHKPKRFGMYPNHGLPGRS